MIFRKPDYSEIKEDARIAEVLSSAKDFAYKIAPEDKKEKVAEIYRDLTVVLCDGDRTFKAIENGKYKDIRFSAAAVKFFDNVDTKEYKTTQGVAVMPQASRHVIKHEVLHAFSSDSGKTADGGGYIKTGSRYAEFDGKGNIVARTSVDLNEAITDALASRSEGKLGPGAGASYSSQVIMADLLMGEKIEDNKFIQDVYFRKGEDFAEDFDKTVKANDVKFADYQEGFTVVGTEAECEKADRLLMGAVEYNLRKATSAEEIGKIYDFQKKVINFYKDGGMMTNFMENEDIARLDKLLQFADKMQNQCKLNLVAQNMIGQQNSAERK